MRNFFRWILGRGDWYVALQGVSGFDGKPKYCITDGTNFLGSYWVEIFPYAAAKRAARRHNRRRVRDRKLKTVNEILEDNRRMEAALRLLDRELELSK